MPAYFGIRIEFDKETLHSHYVADYFSMIERNGVRWIGGARDSEGLCRKDAVGINQSELDGKQPQKKGDFKIGASLSSTPLPNDLASLHEGAA